MLELLPSGGFSITLKDGSIVKGQFNTASLKKFSLLNGGVDFSETLELITSKASFKSYIQFIHCAVEAGNDEFRVLQAIEDMDGFASDDFQRLVGHFTDGYVSKKKIMENV